MECRITLTRRRVLNGNSELEMCVIVCGMAPVWRRRKEYSQRPIQHILVRVIRQDNRYRNLTKS
jgi:hypothetical protein